MLLEKRRFGPGSRTKLTKACRLSPNHRVLAGNMCRSRYHPTLGLVCISIRLQPAAGKVLASVRSGRLFARLLNVLGRVLAVATCLFRLARPTLLSFVGPSASKCRLPRLNHQGISGVLLRVKTKPCFDGCRDCPTALG